MTNEINQTSAGQTEAGEVNRPDFIAKQYRTLRTDSGWKNRNEIIGVAWLNEKGFITVRPNGVQVIEGDIYLHPTDKKDAQ